MKKIVRKNQLIITTLAIMIAVAGYLNYSGANFLGDKTSLVDSDTITEADMDTSDISSEDIYAQTQEILSQDVSGGSSEDTTSSAAETLADYEVLPEVDEARETNSPGTAVLANASDVGVMDQAKLTREQTRAKNKEVLLEIVNNSALAESQKEAAVNQMLAMTQISEKESAAEILLESKGFSDVVVSIQDEMVDVMVYASELTDAQRAQIEDIVKRKTGVSGEKIIITPVQ